MWIANILGGFTMLFIGLIIRITKASSLIAGYNTMSKEEKKKYDEQKLTKFVGNLLIASAVILLIGGSLSLNEGIAQYAISISWLLFTSVIIGGVVYMNTGNRFKR
ncbi:MAG: DUF3784 domain-containing protein [Clostridia bacterium]|nr:DUF3784 domain-containing protein [Clostridia bacterium]